MKKVFRFSLYILIVLILTGLVKTFVFQRAIVDGDSMLNTLNNGDNLIVSKLQTFSGKYKRFDIVVFPHDKSNNIFYIKRIVGMPGETVQIKDGMVYIDDIPLIEHFGKESINDGGIASNPIILGTDEYFVLGDNRNESMDSRSTDVGSIKKKEIMGKVVLRIWPLNSFGTLR
ncbi:MAG: signal peptidase I [Lachnospiraceae bacterium]|nr:signal peptidase I [Lachnospiraceae bacterium]MDN4743167.1 signal peptidase I [Lachnospiraceae bacterium C1.1]